MGFRLSNRMTDSLKLKISDEELEEQEEKLEEIKKRVSQFRHNRPTELKDAWLEEQKAKIAKYLEPDGDEELSSDLQTDSTMEIANPAFVVPEIQIVETENKLSNEDLAKIKKIRDNYYNDPLQDEMDEAIKQGIESGVIPAWMNIGRYGLKKPF